MKLRKSKAPKTAVVRVARSIGTAAGRAVRTAGVVADDITGVARKAASKLPKRKVVNKRVARAKKALGASTKSVKTTARKLVRRVKSARKAVAKRIKR